MLCVTRALSLTWLLWFSTTDVLYVLGHGRLIDPPGRSTAWRYGFKTPTNVNDNQLFCGGFTHQWRKNGGKCGVCGDPWDSATPRANEAGGKYGAGVIVRTYRQATAILIGVELTANHGGYFEMRVCATNDSRRRATQKCLDQHVLTLRKDGASRHYPDRRPGKKLIHYSLPSDLVCSHCVLQWRYVAGNNWGRCENGTSRTGCGPQEEFRACADIRITAAKVDEMKKQLDGNYTVDLYQYKSPGYIHSVEAVSKKPPHNTTHKQFVSTTDVKKHNSLSPNLTYQQKPHNIDPVFKHASPPRTTDSPKFSTFEHFSDKKKIDEYLRRNFSVNSNYFNPIISNDLFTNKESSTMKPLPTSSIPSHSDDEQSLNEIQIVPAVFRRTFADTDTSNFQDTLLEASVESTEANSSRDSTKDTIIAILLGVVFILLLFMSMFAYGWYCLWRDSQFQLSTKNNLNFLYQPVSSLQKLRKKWENKKTENLSRIPISYPITATLENASHLASESSNHLPHCIHDQKTFDKVQSS